MRKTPLFVLDCSVTMAWILLEDSMTEKANTILSLFKEEAQAKVPSIWAFEVANVLCHAEKVKKISALESAEFKEFLAALPIHTENTTPLRAMGSIYTLAKSEQLTIYDAAYLELASRESLPLATFDKALRKAAERMDIVLL
ncbi:MAG: VapC toxin family PIN domain ribonuclease [Gammaproteobacteria bacterium]|nr:MAG: VapC toxin family PIN domain ribonuclease [Gammaproteobacteria bacterium]